MAEPFGVLRATRAVGNPDDEASISVLTVEDLDHVPSDVSVGALALFVVVSAGQFSANGPGIGGTRESITYLRYVAVYRAVPCCVRAGYPRGEGVEPAG